MHLETMPTATPAAEVIGTPASSKARVPPHTEAIDDEPGVNVMINISNLSQNRQFVF
jgi:hypothetical protein